MNSNYRFIYQMRLTYLNGKFGCIFASEESEKEYDQSFIYTIPLEHERDDWSKYEYRFPGLKKEQYKEFYAYPKDNMLVVELDSSSVTFSPISPLPTILTPLVKDMSLKLQMIPYLGNNPIVGNFRLFQPIYPVDIIAMNTLYEQNEAVLVGFTPSFNREVYLKTSVHNR